MALRMLWLPLALAAGCGNSAPPDAASTADAAALADGGDAATRADLAAPPDLAAFTDGSGGADLAMEPEGASVLRHHRTLARDGVYIDAAFTRAAAAKLHRVQNFAATYGGPTYAQPLFLDGEGAGKDLLFVATEQNYVHAFDAAGGALVWKTSLGTPVPQAKLPCGNIDPLGVTGTPVIDRRTRTLFVAAMTTPDGGATKRHLVFALSVDDGKTLQGWPVDVTATAMAGPLAFDSSVQHQRGALAVVGGVLYVPYGGHFGDCGKFHGWVVGIPIANPAAVTAWATRAQGGGVWAPGGIASDGNALYFATGNTFGAKAWSDGEGLIRLAPGPVYSQQPADYFAPSNWQTLDNADLDLGGSNPLLFDLPGATPSRLAIALGKSGQAWLVDRDNFGGVGAGVASAHVSSSEIITAPVTWATANGRYVAFRSPSGGIGCPMGQSGDLKALRIGAAAPPTIAVAWCAGSGAGAPAVSTTDGTSESVVWLAGAESDGRLHGFDGESGKPIYTGGGVGDALGAVRRYQPPIIAKGRLYVAGDTQLYAFSP